MRSVNPATGEELERYEELTDEAVAERLARAEAAFARHRRTPLSERASKLARAAALLGYELTPDKAGTLFPVKWGQ